MIYTCILNISCFLEIYVWYIMYVYSIYYRRQGQSTGQTLVGKQIKHLLHCVAKKQLVLGLIKHCWFLSTVLEQYTYTYCCWIFFPIDFLLFQLMNVRKALPYYGTDGRMNFLFCASISNSWRRARVEERNVRCFIFLRNVEGAELLKLAGAELFFPM